MWICEIISTGESKKAPMEVRSIPGYQTQLLGCWPQEAGDRASLFFPSFFPVPLVLAAVTAPCWRDFLFVTQNKIPVSWYCFQQLQVSAFIAIYKKSTFDLKCHSLQQMHFQVSGPLFNSAWMVENQLKICWTAGERLLGGSTEGPERPFCSLPTIKGGLLERWKGTF